MDRCIQRINNNKLEVNKMSVDYESLIQTLGSETMDDEDLTYTRGEAYQLGQQWRNNEVNTILAAADEQMQLARNAYFQAIDDYKQVYREVDSKTKELTNAINSCFYKYEDFYGPVSLGEINPKPSLMRVESNQVSNHELYLKGDE